MFKMQAQFLSGIAADAACGLSADEWSDSDLHWRL